jgi:hypothetical protein
LLANSRSASQAEPELRLLKNAQDVPGGITEGRERFPFALFRERRHDFTARLGISFSVSSTFSTIT